MSLSSGGALPLLGTKNFTSAEELSALKPRDLIAEMIMWGGEEGASPSKNANLDGFMVDP